MSCMHATCNMKGTQNKRETEREKEEWEKNEKKMTDSFQKLMKSMLPCILNELCPLEAEDHN